MLVTVSELIEDLKSFPGELMFQRSEVKFENLRSQFATLERGRSKCDHARFLIVNDNLYQITEEEAEFMVSQNAIPFFDDGHAGSGDAGEGGAMSAWLKVEYEAQLQEEARLNALIAESLGRVKIDE